MRKLFLALLILCSTASFPMEMPQMPSKPIKFGFSLAELIQNNSLKKEQSLIPTKERPDFFILDLSDKRIEDLGSGDELQFLLNKWQVHPLRILEIRLSDNNISQISPYAFNVFSNLEKINLSNNKLTQLPQNFLSQNPHLTNVALIGNKLANLPSDFLKNSPKLRMLALDRNPISENYIKALLPEYLQKAIQAGHIHYLRFIEEFKKKRTAETLLEISREKPFQELPSSKKQKTEEKQP